MSKGYEIYNTKEKVIRILEEEPATRSSDGLLFIRYCERQLNCKLPEIRKILLSDEFPAFETVRRARQKVQETNPELSANAFVKRARMENQVVFENFARSK